MVSVFLWSGGGGRLCSGWSLGFLELPSPCSPCPIFTDSLRSADERVADLLAQLTIAEKIDLLQSGYPGCERLGLPATRWGGECLHGLVHTGQSTGLPHSASDGGNL